MIVDDSKSDVFLIRTAIESCGLDAALDVVRDGFAATGYIDAADMSPDAPCPDLILLDLNLPKTSGADVLKHVRASSRCKDAKVLIVTSSNLPQDRGSVEDLGIAGYFRKPSDYAEFMKLGSLIQDLLGRRPSQ